MKKLPMPIALVLLLLVGWAFSLCEASPPVPGRYFDYTLEPISLPEISGPAELLLTFKFKPEFEGDTVEVEVIVDGPLGYNGPEKWEVSLAGRAEYSTVLSVDIPPDERTILWVWLHGGGHHQKISRTFLTTGDTLEFLRYVPYSRRPDSGVKSPFRTGRTPQYTEEWKPDPVLDSANRHFQIGVDTPIMTEEELLRIQAEAGMRRLRKLEEKPMGELTAQFVEVDGQIYVRRKGEGKFHPAEGITDVDEWLQHRMDSVKALPLDTEFDVVLYLSDDEKMKIARVLVDSLTPCDSAGYYACRITKAVLLQLSREGIRLRKAQQLTPGEPAPVDEPTSPNEQQDSSDAGDGPSGALPESGVLLFEEGFESSWPGMWDVTDSSHWWGYDYWAPVTCRVYEGQHSCWCAGEGDQSDCSHYDNLMSANMISTVGIDISPYAYARISYYLYHDSYNGDRFTSWWSEDGITWNILEAVEYGNPFTYRAFGVSGDNLYLWFLFTSDDINSYEGSYLDAIRVTGFYPPNLSAYMPDGWPSPFVHGNSGT